MERDIQEILSQSEWKHQGTLITGDIISCKIDGKKVEGEVSISPKDIAVRLISDKINLTSSAHLPLMAPMLYTHEPCKGSSANERGIARVYEMLVGLYHDYQIISDSEQEIKRLAPQYHKLRQDFHQSMEHLLYEKVETKRVFKEGRLDQHTYMSIVSDIRNRSYSLRTQHEKDSKRVFSGILDNCKSCDDLIGAIESIC